MKINAKEPYISSWWCPGAHLQTVWRRLFDQPTSLPFERKRLETPDGDFIDFDIVKSKEQTADSPVLLILHGLEGSSRSKYVLGLLSECLQRGWIGIAMNFRSCSGEINRKARSYHSGETGDLALAVDFIQNLHPGRLIGIAGYSLGGNVLLKWLGERGSRLPNVILGGAAISVPYDLKIAASLIDSAGFNRSVYAYTFLKTLKEKFIRKIHRLNLQFSPNEIQKIRTFHEFDDQVTAPVHGFKNAEEYWRLSSSIRYVDAIQKPVYLLHSKNDPFLSDRFFPLDQIKESGFLTKEITPDGGHVGFVYGKWPWAASYLPEKRIISFFTELMRRER